MKYCAAYYSDIGIQKETNQDSLLLVQRGQTQDDEAVLAVICDGVGGLKMGERSSAAVVTAFRDWFDERVEELYEQEEPETELFDDWDNLIQSLHIRLKDYSEKAGFRSGTTVEAVLFMKGRYYICHVGDCRTYIISDTLTQLTTDHTIVQRELQKLLGLRYCFAGKHLDCSEIGLGESLKIHEILEQRLDFHLREIYLFRFSFYII